MNKFLKQYQQALKRIEKGLTKNTLALEDIESLFNSLTGYAEFLEAKVAKLEKQLRSSPKKSAKKKSSSKPSQR